MVEKKVTIKFQIAKTNATIAALLQAGVFSTTCPFLMYAMATCTS